MTLEIFNQAAAGDAKAQIAHCVALDDWASVLVAKRPFQSQQALLQAADALARQWDERALNQALSAHPRIGEKAQGEGKEAGLSRQEQGQVNADDAALKQALQAGNIAYEQRFGRVFLIRAKGRSGEAILAELQRRLGNNAHQELDEALAQLREITLLRLQETFQ